VLVAHGSPAPQNIKLTTTPTGFLEIQSS